MLSALSQITTACVVVCRRSWTNFAHIHQLLLGATILDKLMEVGGQESSLRMQTYMIIRKLTSRSLLRASAAAVRAWHTDKSKPRAPQKTLEARTAGILCSTTPVRRRAKIIHTKHVFENSGK